MRILIVAKDFPPQKGGIPTYTWNVVFHLAKIGHEVDVIAPYAPKGGSFNHEEGYAVKRIPKLFFIFPFLFWILMYRIWRQDYDVVFPNNWYPVGLVVWACSFFLKIDYVLPAYALEIILPKNSSVKTKLLQYVFGRSQKIIAISDYTKNKLMKLYSISSKKIEVVLIGVDSERFSPGDKPKDLIKKLDVAGDYILLTVASMNYWRKGHQRVIKALPHIIKSIPNVKYIITGHGRYRDRLEKLAIKMGVKENVIFTGLVDEDVLPDYYRLCDIFVMPSGGDESRGDVEGFGIVYVEANACGKPSIGLDIGGCSDAIKDGVTGFLLNSKDPQKLAEKVVLLLHDKSLRRKLGDQGRRRVLEELNWDSLIHEYISVFKKAAASSSSHKETL